MKKYDIIVVGAGPAGISAALYATKNGAKTLLLEQSGFVGGMSTDGLLNVFCGNASGGLYREILEKLTVQKGSHTVYDPEELKQFYLDKISENGIDILLHASMQSAAVENQTINHILVNTGLSSEALEGSFFIDATGNGTLAASSGCHFQLGRETDGKLQPSTLLVRLGGVDDTLALYPKFSTYPEYQALLREAVRKGEVPFPAGHIIIIPEKHAGIVNLNMTNCIDKNGSNSWERTQAELECRRQVMPLVRFLQNNIPGYQNAFLLQTAPYTGIRESRHVEGVYRLSEQDIKNSTVFDDWCATHLCYRFGVHNLNGSGVDHSDDAAGDEYTIPYRSLLAKQVDNLLLTGRCISGTHLAHSSFRVMPICMATGQAAGTAAALAAASGYSLRALPTERYQEILASQGMARP